MTPLLKEVNFSNPLFVIDVGNTSLTCGFIKNGRLTRVKTVIHDNIPKFIKKLSSSGIITSYDVIIACVVPKILRFIKNEFNGTSIRKMWVSGENLPIKLNHKYFDLKRLGVDRRVNIFGALRRFGAPCLIFDFGTALTVDYIARNGVFEGGLIIPGPQVALQALAQKTALLPKNLRLPAHAPASLGRNTRDCMKAGILEGYGAMAEGLMTRFKKRYGKNLRVIATGGFSKTVQRYVKGFDVIDPHHTLKSLALLWASR